MRRFLLFLAVVFLSVSAYAETTPWVKLDNSQIRVIAGVNADGVRRAAVQIRLDEGWKTYWRTAGDAGMPVTIDTTGSANLKKAELLWPAPTRYIDFGTLESFGYKHEVTFPVRLEAEKADAPIDLKLNVKYAACKELCLFLEHRFEMKLPPKAPLTAAEKAILDAADSALPTPIGMQTDITIQSVHLERDLQHVHIEATSAEGFDKPDVMIEGGAAFRFADPEVTLSNDDKKAIFIAPLQVLISDKKITGQEVSLTLVDHGRSVEWKSTLAPSGVDAPYSAGVFLAMIGFALLGGLILNIMPCVLPVLSIKILGVLKKSGKHPIIVRRSFLASAAGIISSFLLLAAIVVGMQAAGKTIGWGFQFQEPYFLIVLSILLAAFAANLFGFFEIRLPHSLADVAQQHLTKRHGYLEHFLTGAFATLMATPCSAPFLGTAIGFAFSQGPMETFILFFAMGIGLAIPYLLFAAFPSLVQHLPKPGVWMVKAKTLLGVLLIATAVWILWILSAQQGLAVSITIGVMLAVLIAAFKLPHKWAIKTVFALVVICLLLPVAWMKKPEEVIKVGLWQPFDAARIKTLVAAGNVVMVDVTADWCLTCKANKVFVLDTKEVVDMLKAKETVAMNADWTNRDPEISNYLKSFGRYGIPFNAVYGPAAPNGIALPELLNYNIVMKALEKARGPDNSAESPRPEELP